MLPIGIDLGTSTSEIAVFRAGVPTVIPDPSSKSPIVPSIVAMDNRGAILVGDSARGHVDVPGRGIREVKRRMGSADRLPLGSQLLRPEEVSAHILTRLVRNAEEALGQSIKDVVVTVPAQFEDAARAATAAAAELAGLHAVRLIQEPTAAAMAYGVTRLDKDERVVVFDFGGGTLDISILEMVSGVLEVDASHGDKLLGGKDFDQCLQDYLLETFRKRNPSASISQASELQLKPFAEGIKRHLSTNTSYSGVLPNFAVVGGTPVNLEVDLTRREFNRLMAGLLSRAKLCLQEALKRAKVAPQAVDQVLLVGGTTYIPAVRDLVAEFFGKPSKASVEPDLAVAMGACVQAAIISGDISSENGLIVADVSPIGLGIDMLGERGGQVMLVYEPLMPPNTKIPYSVKRSYSLLHPDQRECSFRLYQDRTGTAKLPEDAEDTGVVGELKEIPPALYGSPHPVEVEFSYNLDGRAQIRASIPGLGKSLEIGYELSSKYMSHEDKEAAKERIASSTASQRAPEQAKWQQHPRASEFSSLFSKAESSATSLDSDRRERLLAAVVKLKAALEQNQSQSFDKLENELIDLLFELDS